MCLVACGAIGLAHVGGMGLMAFQTIGFLAVDAAVARGAREGGMFTLVLPQLLDLLVVAGETRVGDFTLQRNLQRGVGICVAAQTAFKFEMGLPLVALAAERNRVLHLWGMAGVAILAGDRLVPHSRGCDVSRRPRVAFDAIIIRQGRGGRFALRKTYSAPHKQDPKYCT